MGRWMLVIAVALGLAACADDGGSAGPRPGNEAVYERIESMSDCNDLQQEFDNAMNNAERHPAGDDRRKAPLAYAEAADERMREVGCYD